MPILQRAAGRLDRLGRHRLTATIEPFSHDGLFNVPVPLSADEVRDYYEGFSNSTLWPLYHDACQQPQFHRHWWRPYVAVNERFAEIAAREAAPGASVLVQDYHLQLVPGMLRAGCGPTCGSASSSTSPFRRWSSSPSFPGGSGSSRACWGPTWSASRRRPAPRTSSAWSTATPRTAAWASRSMVEAAAGAGPRVSDLDRLREDRAAGGAIRPRSSGRPRRSGPSSASTARDARRRPARLHQGHRPAAAGPPRDCSAPAGTRSTTWCSCR